MKNTLLIYGSIFLSNFVFAQNQIDSLVQIGIKHHDNGQYDRAIGCYKRALRIDPNSALANYEIAMTYFYVQDYENSLKHSNKVIELDDKHLLQAYITKGSCFDCMGKTEKSIKVFEKGIKEFGDHHLLYYNLGYNYYNLKNYNKAEEAFVNAIATNPDHATSHLLLGFQMIDTNNKVQSLLCLHYFLFLEPNSERAKTAYDLLQIQFSGNVEKNKDKPDQIDIFVDPDQIDSEFGGAELMISLLEASKSLKENEGKSDDELFIENTTAFFKVLGELKKKKNTGLWWDYYVPFFYEIAQSEHIDTYCYYISQSLNKNAVIWLDNNIDKLEGFINWLGEN